ncbi:MAG: GIY-YIG nuclease family protein [Rickettsiales bacterium]
MTSDLAKRIWQHKEKQVDGFSKKYDLASLVYYEIHEGIENAIRWEKQVKNWKRNWKLGQIMDMNSKCKDLYNEIT